MNIDELVQVTEDFYNDLIQYDATNEQQNLGDLCLYHVNSFRTIKSINILLIQSGRCANLLVTTNSYSVFIMHK